MKRILKSATVGAIAITVVFAILNVVALHVAYPGRLVLAGVIFGGAIGAILGAIDK